MKTLLVSSFFGFMLLFLTTSDFSKELFTPEKEVLENPLDRILGEKLLDDGTLRKDNFDSILHIRASYLRDSSEIYKIQKLSEHVFLLIRKRCFLNTRNYSLFVKTEGDKIVSYHRIPDFGVNSALVSNKRIYFICDDNNSNSRFRKPSYYVGIACLDSNFDEMWKIFSRSDQYFFYAAGLTLKKEGLHAEVEVQRQGSSTMCTDFFDVQFTKSGKATSSEFIGAHSCGGRNVPELETIHTMFKD